MIYGSFCTGIAGDHVAWSHLGWQAKWFAEIDPFCNALLQHYYPEVPNLGRTVDGRLNRGIDLLVGGTPCQSYSVAGNRKGLADPRGNLALDFCRLARDAGAQWVVWENVPGMLSSFSGEAPSEESEWQETSDFATFLGYLQECGYGWAYRLLNSEYFGSAQHRRRLIVVGYLGDWRPAAAVLFEQESLHRNPPARRKTGQEVAGTLGGGSGERGWCNDLDRSGAFIPCSVALRGREGGGTAELGDDKAGTLRAVGGGGNHSYVLAPCGCAFKGDLARTVTTEQRWQVPFGMGDKSRCLTASVDYSHLDPQEMFVSVDDTINLRVRRLTPVEFEKLQGFPIGYTAIPYRRGKIVADGPRYKSLGNAFNVFIMRWVGERINTVEKLLNDSKNLR